MSCSFKTRCLPVRLSLLVFVVFVVPRSFGETGVEPLQRRAADIAPAIVSAEPTIVGVGTKIRIRGARLGTPSEAAVVFAPEHVTTWVEKHTPTEIIVQVPIGAESGPLRVVIGAGSADRLAAASPADRRSALAHAACVGTTERLLVVAPFVRPVPPDQMATTRGGLKLPKNRLIVDLHDFHGFEDTVRIARQINGELAGFIAPTNSYVIDLKRPPADVADLYALTEQVRQDARVADVWHDIQLEPQQVVFADPDVVDRYDIVGPEDGDPYGPYALRRDQLHGRMDVWAYDRIQAPAAWNLIKRFVGAPAEIKVAVLDSGCDQTHPEFDATGDGDVDDPGDVHLKKVGPPTGPEAWIRVHIAGSDVELPPVTSLIEQPYDLGDDPVGPPPFYHGTAVTSIIGALNGNDLGGGDRGMNGILSPNGGAYTIQIYPGSEVSEGDTYCLTEFLAVVNSAAITGARVLNASWGQPHPIDPADPDLNNPTDPQDKVRVGLRKLAKQLRQFEDELLLCVAAGNEAVSPLETWDNGHVTPFEDFDFDRQLDPGEDINGNGVLDHGNYIAASLGTLPNVITVGAIGGPNLDPGGVYRGWARDDKRADFSNWGSHAVDGPDLVVHVVAPGVDVFAAESAGPIVIGKAQFNRFSNRASHAVDSPDLVVHAVATGVDVFAGKKARPIVIGGGHFNRDDVAGTSFSTPLVTGTAALLMAVDDAVRGGAPALLPAQIKQLILDTTFPVDTTDGNGDGIVWNTLKAGAAVRKLLVDRGVIADDEPWSGLTKLLGYFTIGQERRGYEVRQDPTTRRPVAFREFVSIAPFTELASELSPDGKKLVRYDGSTDVLYEWNIETDETRVVGQPDVDTRYIRWLRYAGPHEILTYWHVDPPGLVCPTQEGTERILLSRNGQEYTKLFPPPFETYFFHPTSQYQGICVRADNREVHVSIEFSSWLWDPDCEDGHWGLDSVEPSWLLPYPNAGGDIPYPEPEELPFDIWCQWSPDGRLYYGSYGWPGVRRDGPRHPVLWSSGGYLLAAWSPDASEMFYGPLCYRRDGSGPPYVPPCGHPYSWSW